MVRGIDTFKDEGDLVIQIGIKPNTLEDFIKTYKLYLSNL